MSPRVVAGGRHLLVDRWLALLDLKKPKQTIKSYKNTKKNIIIKERDGKRWSEMRFEPPLPMSTAIFERPSTG